MDVSDELTKLAAPAKEADDRVRRGSGKGEGRPRRSPREDGGGRAVEASARNRLRRLAEVRHSRVFEVAGVRV